MARAIWADRHGVEHFVDEMTDHNLTQAFDFLHRWVQSLNEQIGKAWELADFAGDGLAVSNEVYGDIEQLNEELIVSVAKRTVLHREMKTRGLN